jgi:glycosyltransferase involved in cell wall biosynthesis
MAPPIPSRPTTAARPDGGRHGSRRRLPPLERPPAVEIVIPVHDEAHVLEGSVEKLLAHMQASLPFTFRITIADNASGDGTLAVAETLAARHPEVAVLHLERKGRGRALRAAWSASRCDVLAYMDVDLSTGLEALGPLLEPLLGGRADIAIGSGLAPGSEVTRSLRRELISRAYNILLRLLLRASVADAQCGFKAGRREVLQQLLGEVEDEEWFFDTELLHAARRRRMAIREVPVRWVEDSDSRVAIVATALADLRGIARLRRAERRAQAPAARSRTGASASCAAPTPKSLASIPISSGPGSGRAIR